MDAFIQRLILNDNFFNRLDIFPDRTIFQTKSWIKFIQKSQSADPVIAVLRDNNKEMGYFTDIIKKRFGLKFYVAHYPDGVPVIWALIFSLILVHPLL